MDAQKHIKLWMHLRITRDFEPFDTALKTESVVYPWPFENNGRPQTVTGWNRLIAYYQISKFKQFGGGWVKLPDFLQFHRGQTRLFWWMLHPSIPPIRRDDNYQLIPEEFINALARSS